MCSLPSASLVTATASGMSTTQSSASLRSLSMFSTALYSLSYATTSKFSIVFLLFDTSLNYCQANKNALLCSCSPVRSVLPSARYAGCSLPITWQAPTGNHSLVLSSPAVMPQKCQNPDAQPSLTD